MNSKDIKNLLNQLNKRSNAEEAQEMAITWSESALNSIEDQNAIQLLLLLMEIKTTPSIVTSFVDKLINSDFNSDFILKIIAKISLKFAINSKKLLGFLVPIKSRLSAQVLSNFWSNNQKSRETYFKQLVKELQQKLDSNDVILSDIDFDCKLLALLIASSGQFCVPVTTLLKIVDKLSTPPTSDLTVVVSLRTSCFYILDSLLVTLENDFLIFVNQINKTIVDSIELNIPTIDSFLVKYLSISSSFRFNSQQLNQILKTLLARIQTNPEYNSALNALKCINAIVSAHYPYVECCDWAKIYEHLTKLLLQYYRSKEPKILEKNLLRQQLLEVILALNTSHTTLSILNLALIRDENHVIRDFCGKRLRRVDSHVTQVEEEVNKELMNEEISENIEQNEETIEEDNRDEEEVMIIDDEVIDGAQELLKDFVFE